ncbi:ALPK1 kinase, partial [Atlantisia rogersi]|nr:ALPK1 kinase [Atlantisia rogersi]
SGKLLKAEYILSSLINDNGATGTWRYAKESDRILVQSVCLQIRGQILQKLGMWYEAAELIWASVVGYFQLPQPDKKGIATSLGILADIFASMNDKDYVHFKTSAQIDLSLLQESSHRLLSAAEACKLAAAYSQYTPLFVLTAVNIRGVCLLSYSHSKDCPPEKRNFYLSEAKESFEIGLLTKNDSSPITSKQELHNFIKAAFCLATVHRWLYGESEELSEVKGLCREAMGKLHLYSTPSAEEEEKGRLAREIMSLIAFVKKRLRVGSFPNSDGRSYVPDSYKGAVGSAVLRGEASFEGILTMHSQHHLSVCGVFENTCRVHHTASGETQVGACITTLRTETTAVDTACATEETACQKEGVGKTLDSPTAGSSSRRLCGQRNKYTRSDVMKSSLDEEMEPGEVNGASSAFSRWRNRSQTTTSESSWCKLSKSSYSSSWEELNPNSSKDSPREGQQQDKDSAEMLCCTTKSDENGQAAYLCSLPPRAHSPSPREPQRNHGASPQPSLEVDAHRARRPVENTSLCGEELREGKSSSEEKAGEVNNTDTSLSTPSSVPKRPEEDKSSSWEELGCRTKDSGGSRPRSRFVGVQADGEAAESTEDPFFETRPSTNEAAPALLVGAELRSGDYVRAWLGRCATVGNGHLEGPAVDAQAETVDDTEFEFIGIGDSAKNCPTASVPKRGWTPGVPTASPSGRKLTATEDFNCATTEEDEEKSQDVVSSKRQSSSSLSSWYKPTQTPKSSPEVSFLNPREGGFVFVPGRTKEEILEARVLSDDDYTQLLAGVEHNWLVQRLTPTGVFKSKQLHKAYSALLLKYSKKSGLWTGQETAVFIGDYLNVAKEGKQRSAFWIHFLHQEESLGRY